MYITVEYVEYMYLSGHGRKKNVLITNSIPKSKGKIQKSNHGPFKKLDEGQVP